MKRLTIAMGDDLYASLVEFAAEESKRQVRRMSLGEAARTLILEQLNHKGHSPEIARPSPLEPTPRRLG